MTEINSSTAPEPVGPYPHAKKIGSFVFLSGVGPRKKGQKEIPGVVLDSNNQILEYDIEIQTHAVIENVLDILKASGLEKKNIIDITVYLTNMKNDFKIFNKVYGEYFSANGPTRTTVEVGALPTPIAVEFKVIAHI